MSGGLEFGTPYDLNGETLYAGCIEVEHRKRVTVLVAPSSTDDVTAQKLRYAVTRDGELYEVVSITREPFHMDLEPTFYAVADLVPMANALDGEQAQYEAYINDTAADLLADVNI